MGGRRSRYWCGPGIFRETKKAPGRGFTGQWSAPTFLKRKGKNESDERQCRQNDGSENTLKYKRNETRPLPDLINELIDKCLGAILSLDFKASIANLITLIRLRLKLMPPDITPPRVIWVD
jgi:hypothetical protein